MASRLLNLFRRSVAPALGNVLSYPHRLGPRVMANVNFYYPTLRRWIYNEDGQRTMRTVWFNTEVLASIAARAVKARRCISFEKIAEGGHSRVFLLHFDNGSEAIARIPLPVVGDTHLMTASEVATMDFARTVLNIPVPRVLAWSSEPTEVGADFIICEKTPGRELHHIWSQATRKTCYPLLYVSDQINSVNQKFLDSPALSSYGSILYKKDVEALPHEPIWPDGKQDKASEKFVIGPMMNWDFWYGERATMEVNRGPWKDPTAYITALIRCEQEWLHRYARPRTVGDPFIRSDEDNSPAAHIELLDKLFSVLHALIPDPEITPPTLWHPDLRKSNIFISPTPPHNILSVIDWQTAKIAPMYLQTAFPQAMLYTGGRFKVSGSPNTPSLPEGFEELSTEEKAILKEHQWQAFVQKYQMELIKRDVRHLTGLAHPYAPLFIEPIFLAPRHGLKRSLTLIQLNWDILSDDGTPCPLKFSPEEINRTAEVAERWKSYDARVESLSRELGVGIDGRIDEVERFELVKRKNNELLGKWDTEAAGGPYPFQDLGGA